MCAEGRECSCRPTSGPATTSWPTDLPVRVPAPRAPGTPWPTSPRRVPAPRLPSAWQHPTVPIASGTGKDHIRDTAVRRCVRLVGELAVTVAVVIVLFVAYQLYVVSWSAAENQRQVAAQLQQDWGRSPPALPGVSAPTPEVSVGDPFAVIRIPALGADWEFTVVEGTAQEQLARGPGHYVGTSFPGQPGNVGIAGHRVTHATPFDRLDELGSCDAVVIETRDAWFVYRVLPLAEERANWQQTRDRPECTGVAPLAGDYSDTVGREIVTPDRTDVLAVVPHRPDLDLPVSARQHLLTLTTCHPKFSARQRMVVHAVQVSAYDKREQAPGFRPSELAES